MALLRFPEKDPNDVLDYEIDWSEWLGADTIATSTFSLTTAAGVVIDSDTKTDTTATVWLSGGNVGATAEILNRITTAGGRTKDQSAKIKFKAH